MRRASDAVEVAVLMLVPYWMQGSAHVQVAEHGARTVIYTGVRVPSAVPQWGRMVAFDVDRLFVYALMTRDRLPLFIGAVRNLWHCHCGCSEESGMHRMMSPVELADM